MESIALSSPRLWALLHIPLAGEGCQWIQDIKHRPDYANASDVQSFRVDMSRLMRSRCEAVEAWLARAGTSPLSISLTYPDLRSDYEQKGEKKEFITKILAILRQYTCQWEALDLYLPFIVYESLDNHVPVQDLLKLRELRLYIYNWDKWEDSFQP